MNKAIPDLNLIRANFRNWSWTFFNDDLMGTLKWVLYSASFWKNITYNQKQTKNVFSEKFEKLDILNKRVVWLYLFYLQS